MKRLLLWALLSVAAVIAVLIVDQPDDPHPCQAPPLAPLYAVDYGSR